MGLITKITLPVASFRRINSPFEMEGKRIYLAVVKASDLPKEFEDWRSINPRDPKKTSGVAKAIAESLRNNPESFLFLNRGLTVLSKAATFDNTTNELALEFSDKDIHGLLDGGHTYAVIRDAFDSLEESEKGESELDRAFVKLEILVGFTSKEETMDIVGARNTSTQVKDQSLANLLKHFDSIKKALENETYANRIAYKETEYNDEGERKDIDIKEILSYLICFDREGFNDYSHPIIAYSSKSAVLKYAETNRDRLQKYIPLLPEILKMRDIIYETMPETWNRDGKGKFGSISGVDTKKSASVELPFTKTKSKYSIPSSFIYPILASLRNLVEVRDDKCVWLADPEKFYNDYKDGLVRRMIERAMSDRNPNRTGKEKAAWESCYDYAEKEMLKRRLK